MGDRDRPEGKKGWAKSLDEAGLLDEIDDGWNLPEGATEGATIQVAADRGWQSTGLLLERGRKYRFEAEGRYQIARDPQVWWCEPNGVTIRYHGGLPLGILLGAVVDERKAPEGWIAAVRSFCGSTMPLPSWTITREN